MRCNADGAQETRYINRIGEFLSTPPNAANRLRRQLISASLIDFSGKINQKLICDKPLIQFI
ncbi:MAG: hypothetical protein A4S08_04060 [Proteobacteria bacterium SG_bin4]|nr:MAG: hypothetical protein A4S08_04060 [Proteobacteria bacterium SG_bin4]